MEYKYNTISDHFMNLAILQVLVIPALEFHNETEYYMPENKSVACQLVANNKLEFFHK